MNEDSKIEFFEEKKDINYKSIKKEDVFLFLTFFILFCFINIFLYLYLYKTTWPTPHFFSFILLNYPLLFMAWGCFLFFIHPSIVLSKIVKTKYETNHIQDEKPKIRISFIAIVVFYIIICLISIIGGFAFFGFTWWVIVVLLIVFVEFLLFRFLICIFALFSKILNIFLLKINIISFVLLLVIIAGFINAPALSCGMADYKCIAGKAAEKNNPHICEKVSSPFAPKDCYVFLIIANDNTCFCELVKDAREKKLCYGNSFFDDLDGYKNDLKKFYNSELEKARFKDDSILNGLNCSNSVENRKKDTQSIIAENIAEWGITTIVRDWYKSKNTYAGFLEDNTNQEKIRMVINKVKNEISYDIEYYVYTTSNSFVVKAKRTDNIEAFSCRDRFVGDVKSRVDINGDNFRAKTNCYGDNMDNFVAPKDTPEIIKSYGSQTFQQWYNIPIKNSYPDAFK